jgi:hypothetical protein
MQSRRKIFAFQVNDMGRLKIIIKRKINKEVKTLINLFFHHQFHYNPLLGPGLFCNYIIIFIQMVGLFGRVISPLQGLYVHTGQRNYRTNSHTDIHILSVIRTHDPSVPASEENSCLRPRGHFDRSLTYIVAIIFGRRE